MKKYLIYVMICMMLLITKYVVSGGYYDYTLRETELQKLQDTLIDDNKRFIAELENYRSANYLFSQKDNLGLEEITPEKTILLKTPSAYNEEVLAYNSIVESLESDEIYRKNLKQQMGYQTLKEDEAFHAQPQSPTQEVSEHEFNDVSSVVASEIKKSNENNINNNVVLSASPRSSPNNANDTEDGTYRWSINGTQ